MNLQLDDEQLLIKNTAREFLAQSWNSSRARSAHLDPRGCDDGFWRDMADLGWMRLLVPEEYGGAGANIMDVIVLVEETGYAGVRGPFFSVAVLGALCLRYAASPEACARLLPSLADGDLRLALVLNSQRAGFSNDQVTVTVEPRADEPEALARLHGMVSFVADVEAADQLLCPALKGGGIELYLVPSSASGLSCTPMPNISWSQLSEITLKAVEPGPDGAIGAPGAVTAGLTRALQVASVAKCAEMVGGAERVLDIAVEYARERVQFGRPIGSFQAIQHRCADMLMDLQCARWLTYKAAAMIDRGQPDPALIAKAKIFCNGSYRRIVRQGHQIMGGVGYCEDHPMPLYFRHARMAETTFGDSDAHLAMLANHLLGSS